MMRPLRLLALVTLLAAAAGCDPSGGERGYFEPDMTWGPGSNALYTTDGSGDPVERFCEHVHAICADYPQDYEDCLMSWSVYEDYCPDELAALMVCMDSLYTCGSYGSWQWWEFMSSACAAENMQLEYCLGPYYWD